MSRPVHVVGGGIAGLVAAITVAEGGGEAVVHEATHELGGRARGGTGWPGVNFGPHVAFTDGALLRWLRSRRLGVSVRAPKTISWRLLDDRGLRLPVPALAALGATMPRREAPDDERFDEWAAATFGAQRAAVLCRLAGLYTFHHDPGGLSARFIWERWRRTFLSPDRVRWISGGWSTLVDALGARATELGVSVQRGDRVTSGALPAAPVILAVPLPAAGRLLGRPVEWPGARTALVDVIVRRRRHWPDLIADVRSDTATCCMIERETAFERSLVGRRDLDLFQCHLGVAPDADPAVGLARIEDALDAAAPGWRERLVWHRGHVVHGGTGAVDPPGTTWHDRPPVEQGDDVFLAGDAVAAPGMLSEVSVNSALEAGRLALEAARQRVFAPGWPTVALTPRRRLEVLAAVLPGASLTEAPPGGRDRELEPVDATGPGYRLEVSRGIVRAVAVDPSPAAGTGSASVLVARRPGRFVPLRVRRGARSWTTRRR